jgi:hypothetical protein
VGAIVKIKHFFAPSRVLKKVHHVRDSHVNLEMDNQRKAPIIVALNANHNRIQRSHVEFCYLINFFLNFINKNKQFCWMINIFLSIIILFLSIYHDLPIQRYEKIPSTYENMSFHTSTWHVKGQFIEVLKLFEHTKNCGVFYGGW